MRVNIRSLLTVVVYRRVSRRWNGRVGVGALLSVVGVVWILQGANVIHGSSMSGRGGYYGVQVTLVIGAVLLGWAWRRRSAT